jgi:hypothetical protein
MSEAIEICVVCRNNQAMENHHLWPTHLGGAIEGPTVWLCATCHRDIHKCASRLYRGKPLGIIDDNWLRRAMPLISRIVKALREFEGATLDNINSKIVIEIPKNDLRLIHLRKMDLGFSSLQKYIMALIKKDMIGN